MLRDERSQRREEGGAVTSSDEERDLRRVDAQLQGISGHGSVIAARKGKGGRGRRRAEKKDQQQQQHDIESTLFHHDPSTAQFDLKKKNTLLTFDSDKQTTSFSESFHVKGMNQLTATSHSYDARLLKQIEKQKELLQAAGYMAFQSEKGEQELQDIAKQTKKMRSFWKSFSSSPAGTAGYSISLGDNGGIEAEFVVGDQDNLRQVHMSSDSHLHVHGSVRGLDQTQSAALVASSKKMREFWRAVEAKSLESSPDRLSSARDRPELRDKVQRSHVPCQCATQEFIVGLVSLRYAMFSDGY